jgi:hypothetical protein
VSILDRFFKKTIVKEGDVMIAVACDPVPSAYQEPALADAWRAGFKAGALKGMDAGVTALANSINNGSAGVHIDLQNMPSQTANDV